MATTLTVHRRTLAALLGEVEVGTADAGVATTVLGVSTPLASGARVRSTVLPASLFRGKWLYRPAATNANDRDRLIAEYAPTTGLLTPDEPWTVSPGGEAFEILGLFSGSDLNALVNEALKRCMIVTEFTVAVASTQATRHSLAVAAPWLRDPRWILRVGVLPTGTDPLVSDPFARRRSGEAVLVDGVVYLDGLAFNTTDTAYVTALKPAFDHCAAAASPTAFTQSGLAAEGDLTVVDPVWVAWVAVLAAADRLAHLERTGEATQEALRARQMAAARVTLLTAENLVVPTRTFFPRPTYLGSSLPGRGRRW